MDKNYQIVKEKLENHGVIAFATETVMGLGVYFDDEIAYHKMNEIKRRPEDKPYTMMLGSKEDIVKYAFIGEREQKIIDKFVPGPITMLLKAKNVPGFVTHNGPTIGIRVPDYKISLDLLKAVQKPLLVPSANRSGEKPCLNSKEVKEVFDNELDLIVEGEAGQLAPSTIVDLTGEDIKIIRQGPITLDMILKEIN